MVCYSLSWDRMSHGCLTMKRKIIHHVVVNDFPSLVWIACSPCCHECCWQRRTIARLTEPAAILKQFHDIALASSYLIDLLTYLHLTLLISYIAFILHYLVTARDVKWNPENRISVPETKSGSTFSASEIRIYLFFHFRQGIYTEITKYQVKLIQTFV